MNAPPDKITSLAFIVCSLPFFLNVTPVTLLLPSKLILVTNAGYNKTPDVNGFRQEGFGPFDSQVHNGRRVSASRAYLHPAMRRKNLDVQTRAFVTKINFEGNNKVSSLPFFLNVTPVTLLLPSKLILVTNARVCTSKFLRLIAGCTSSYET